MKKRQLSGTVDASITLGLEALKYQSNTRHKRFFLLVACLLQLFCMQPSYADFINGGFEDTYTPTGGGAHPTITGWTQTGYTFNGSASTTPPTSISGINLAAATATGAISDIINGTNQTIADYFLLGSTPTNTLFLPIIGIQSAIINLRSINAPLTKSGTGAATGFATVGKNATALSQQVTIQASDFDPKDGKVHIRFIGAPVVENPVHAVNQQPFYAVQVNNITTGRVGSNPLYFQWSYAGQPGAPWKSLTGAGSNSGSNTSYQYTDIQAFDISPGNAFIRVGDTIELVVLASGCSLSGHEGHMTIDGVSISIPYGLWVVAAAPLSATPGDNVTYTYTYTNTSPASISGVQLVLNLPKQGTPSSPPAESTTYVSNTTPTAGTSPSCAGTNPVTCTIGTLAPGQSGTVQLTVNIPSGWLISTGPVNNGNYPISGTGLDPLLGPLVQTALLASSSVSNLVANTSGLPATATVGTAYSGTFTCSNTPTGSATGAAPSASCDIANLPAGLTVAGCTISPSSVTWIQPSDIPSNQTVTCSVTGTPTTAGSLTATVTTDAANNSNSTTNRADATITVSSSSTSAPAIPATLDGSPTLSVARICCGRPLILGELPVAGPGSTTYVVSSTTGNARCIIGHSGSQTYMKMNGAHSGDSCTIVGTKNGVTSAPYTVVTP